MIHKWWICFNCLLGNEHALKICYTVSAPLFAIRDLDFAGRKRRKWDLGFTAPVPCAPFLATLWNLPAPVIRRLLKDTSVASLNQVFEVGDEIDLDLPRTPIEAAAYKGNYEVFIMSLVLSLERVFWSFSNLLTRILTLLLRGELKRRKRNTR